MDAGIIGWVVGRGVGGMGALLTDAGHLDDIHLSRPECRRTERSPDEFIFEREKWTWLQICVR